MTPLLGAYIADVHLGRYNTICIAVVIAFIGHIILIVSALPGIIENSQSALGVFVLGQIVTGLGMCHTVLWTRRVNVRDVGTGLFKSNISPLIAEQYRRTKLFIDTTKSGERVIVDPAMTISRVYMVCHLFFSIRIQL